MPVIAIGSIRSLNGENQDAAREAARWAIGVAVPSRPTQTVPAAGYALSWTGRWLARVICLATRECWSTFGSDEREEKLLYPRTEVTATNQQDFPLDCCVRSRLET